MSWYRAVTTDAKDIINIPGTADASWLKPQQQIHTAAGKHYTVRRCVADSSSFVPQLTVTLTARHGPELPPGSDVWFTLDANLAAVSSPPASSSGASAYPPAPSYPAAPDADFGPSSSSSTSTHGAKKAGRGRHHNEAQPPPKTLSSLAQSLDDIRKLDGGGGADEPVETLAPAGKTVCGPLIFLFLMHMGVLAVNIQFCQYIGSFRIWTAVVGYVLLGYQFLAMATSVLTHIVGTYWFRRDDLKFVNLALVIVNFVVVLSMGIPLAWTSGRQTAASNWLEAPMTQSVNCWRQPNMTFNQFDTSFITFGEQSWVVDYMTRDKQKIVADVELDDAGAPVATHMYIVAPLRYTGNVPCNIKIFVACFATLAASRLSSIAPQTADARTCGWELPVTGVVLRVINNNEAFFNFADASDAQWWYKAWQLTGWGNVQGPRASVFAWYSGESPNDIQDEFDLADDAATAVEICMWAIGGFFLFVIAFCLLRLRSDSRSCDCECCDCSDFCDCFSCCCCD